MKKELKMLKEFNEKFKIQVPGKPSLISEDRFLFRNKILLEESSEYIIGAAKGDIENVAKELADILYVVYGTILEHGLEEKMEEIFEEVHHSNMSKDFDEYKMVKGKNYFKPNLKKIFNK
jgi:predicted HAD superfamily Cof-like phosphohydrolase